MPRRSKSEKALVIFNIQSCGLENGVNVTKTQSNLSLVKVIHVHVYICLSLMIIQSL